MSESASEDQVAAYRLYQDAPHDPDRYPIAFGTQCHIAGRELERAKYETERLSPNERKSALKWATERDEARAECERLEARVRVLSRWRGGHDYGPNLDDCSKCDGESCRNPGDYPCEPTNDAEAERDANRAALAAAVEVAEQVQMLITMIVHERENGPTKRGMDTTIMMTNGAVKRFAAALADPGAKLAARPTGEHTPGEDCRMDMRCSICERDGKSAEDMLVGSFSGVAKSGTLQRFPGETDAQFAARLQKSTEAQ